MSKTKDVRKTLKCKKCGDEYTVLEPVDSVGVEQYRCFNPTPDDRCGGEVEYV